MRAVIERKRNEPEPRVHLINNVRRDPLKPGQQPKGLGPKHKEGERRDRADNQEKGQSQSSPARTNLILRLRVFGDDVDPEGARARGLGWKKCGVQDKAAKAAAWTPFNEG